MRDAFVVFTAVMASIGMAWGFAAGLKYVPDYSVIQFLYLVVAAVVVPYTWIKVVDILGGIRGN